LSLAVCLPGTRAQSATANTEMTAPSLLVRQWHADDGLPDESVYQLLQDQTGFLWIAGRGFVVRFDGSTFLRFPAPESRNTFYTMAQPDDGSVILTPRNGDPLRYRRGGFTREPLPAPYTGNTIGYSLVAPDGATWYSVRGAVLRMNSSGTETFGPADGINEQNWTRFAVDGQQRVWLASGGFLGRYENNHLVAVSLPANGGDLRIATTREGGPWVVTATQVLKLDNHGRPEVVADLPPLIGSHYVNTACEDHLGQLWLGTRSQGIHVVGRKQHVRIAVSSDTVTALLEDRDGTLWAATNNGLCAISTKIYTLFDKSRGLATSAVSAVCADNEGEIWAANGDGGVAHFHDGHVDERQLQHRGRVFAAGCVTRRADGGVWAIAGAGAALFQVSSTDATPVLLENVDSLHATAFTHTNGDLWFLVSDRRIGRLQGKGVQVFGQAEGLTAAGVRSFAEDDQHQLLVGTNDGLVLRFDGVRFVPVLPAGTRLESAINAMLVMDHQLWLATASNGLALWSDGAMTRVDHEAGLPDDNLTQLAPDNAEFLWCGSGSGVFRLRITDVQRLIRHESSTLPTLRLGKDEGLTRVVCQGTTGPGVARSRDGRLWFATRQGVLAIEPKAPALTPRPPTVAIEEVLSDDQPQPLVRPFVAVPHAHKLEIRFSTLCLAAPSRVVARYRLDGFDSDWIPAGPAKIATYPRLPPGKYRFNVTVGFGDPSIPERTDQIEIVVPPRWWQTILFQLSAFALLVAAITLMARVWFHRRLRRRLEKLERESAVARERARIAQNIHDDVGASLTRISLLTQAGIPHSPDAENLNRIYETAREITRSLDEIVWAVNPQDDTLESFASYLTDFAQKFLDVAGIRCRLAIPAALPAIPLSSETRHHLFLCCREALNNVVRHAGASEVVIQLALQERSLLLAISDNGHGLPTSATAASPDRSSSGHGLANLQERMRRLGGQCTVQSSSSGGTIVTLTVTLPSPQLS
jgi:signal transduction histidine kinase/ligand-binding sensor domain-containing protein